TIAQHANFLKKKGYYYGEASGSINYKKNKRAIVTYKLVSGERYYIDSVYVLGNNDPINRAYIAKVGLGEISSLKGQPFDRDVLENHRTVTSKNFRDDAVYGFSPSLINFIVDTTIGDMKVSIGVQIFDRVKMSENMRDTLAVIPLKTTYVRNVYFHISDTSMLERPFNEIIAKLGLQPFKGQFLQTTDTLDFDEIIDKKTGQLDPERHATFLYNGELFVRPEIIESQNYLEETNIYKEYYIDRTYSRLLQLGLFQVIKPEIIEVEDSNYIDVHYYLTPSKQQSFGIEPRATNSNGFLGLSASINYTNKNLFRGAQRLTLTFRGGFESQPPVFDPNEEEKLIENNSTSFNTFDIGPSFQLDLPGLFPTSLTALSKRHRPKTVISGAYNFQQRSEYTRNTFQANYLWKMYVLKTQVFQYGLPLISVLKYVNIKKAAFFDAQINLFNDLFLRNAYSDQLIWQDWKFIFEYNNKDKDFKKTKFQAYYNGSFDPAGNFISLFQAIQDTNGLGQYQIFGVPYSRFVRIDNDVIFSYPITKKSSLHFRNMSGVGITTGNKGTSLPFDYSFFGGGSNDNRGWRARTLGPGTYAYWLDTNRTLTQIGDVRMSSSLEYRRSLGNTLKMAVFMDAGNIWTTKFDNNRPGSQLTKDWLSQLAYSGGVGLRFDLDFFVVRLDMGFPLNNPSLPEGSRWIWQSRQPYQQALFDEFGEEELTRLRNLNKIPSPFVPQFHFGIGYPF
ncbi:MAG: BamA/TamA family outer membrane protein, partial [Bacteroidetes bacterium]|nr:BamA/TamA family outer membrane protein [Bacteroidota bacterium]